MKNPHQGKSMYEIEWSEEEIDMLRSLIAKGHSAGSASKALLARNRGGRNFTRNAVIGKCRRLGLKLNAPSHRVMSSPYDKIEPVHVTLAGVSKELKSAVFEELREKRPYKEKGTCLYICEDGKSCGEPCHGSYCKWHYKITHKEKE